MSKPRETVQLPKAVQEIIDRIVEGYDPERVIIFGSYARGDASEGSDLDVLVVKETEEREIQRRIELSRLIGLRNLGVDVIAKTPGEVQYMLDRRSLFMHTIMDEGVVAYER